MRRFITALSLAGLLAGGNLSALLAYDYQNMGEIGNATSIERRYSRPYHQLYEIRLNVTTFAPDGVTPTTVTWIVDQGQWSKLSTDAFVTGWCSFTQGGGGSDCTVGSPPNCGYDSTTSSCQPDSFGACLYLEGYVLRSAADGRYSFFNTFLLTNYYNCSH